MACQVTAPQWGNRLTRVMRNTRHLLETGEGGRRGRGDPCQEDQDLDEGEEEPRQDIFDEDFNFG